MSLILDIQDLYPNYEDFWERYVYLTSSRRSDPCPADDLALSYHDNTFIEWILKRYDPIAYELLMKDFYD